MRMHGQEIKGPNVETVVIPRHYGDVVFQARAVLSYKGFDEICPRPKPPMIVKPGKQPEMDPTDKDYLEALSQFSEQRFAWLILDSLSATEGLTWDTVNMADPKTWLNYRTELEASGFADPEIARIIGAVMAANGLDESKVEEARQRFLASQAEKLSKQFSQNIAQMNTQSGEPPRP